MPSLGSTTLLRGFKVSVAVLDAFLADNYVAETFGTPPYYRDHPDNDMISRCLSLKIKEFAGKVDKQRFRVVIPSRAPYNASTVAYITCAWVMVFAHCEVDLEKDLPAEVPDGFEEARQEIMAFADQVDDRDRIPDEGKMGTYMVNTYEIRGMFMPDEVLDRKKTQQRCEECQATFNDPHHAFGMLQKHRILAHGVREGTNPLPNA